MAVNLGDRADIDEHYYLLQPDANPKEIFYEPEVPNLPMGNAS